MKLDTFITKHNLNLNTQVYLACVEGINLMDNSIDPHHNSDHVLKILDHLDYLLTSSPHLKTTVRFDILLPSICWHDVWISGHQAHGLFELMYLQLVEGRRSAKIWNEYSSKMVSNDLRKSISYCIRKHSSIQIIPRYTLESKILIDLDKLEVWNIDRFLGKRKTFVSKKELFSKYIVRIYYQYSWYTGLYFSELNKSLNILKNNFWFQLK